VKSTTTVAYEVLREVRRSGGSVDADKVEIECAPRVAEILNARERDYLDGLEKKFQKLVVVVAQKSWKPDQYRVAGKMSTDIAAEEAKQAAALGHAPPPTNGGGSRGGKRRRRGGRGRS
jgi:ribonuclease G